MYAVWGLRGRGHDHGDGGDYDGRENENDPAFQKKCLHRLQAS